MPYHYTAFYDAHLNGCSVMRPLFFSWPTDTASYLNDRQWMLGDGIMVAPILVEGTTTVPAYFPAGVWYDLYNHSSIDTSAAAQHYPVTVGFLPNGQIGKGILPGTLHAVATISRMPQSCIVILTQQSSTCTSSNQSGAAPELPAYCVQAELTDNPPVFILGGTIIPLGQSGMMTTSFLRASNLTLLAAFPSPNSPAFERCGQGCSARNSPSRLVACSHMYLDHGGSAPENSIYNLWKMHTTLQLT